MAELLSLHAYMEKFGTERACWNHLRRARWGPDGFECPRCGETERWGLIETRKLFQCHACRYQCSITAGTIMQDTKLPLTTWFLAARLVLTFKKGISSHELGRQLGVCQETAWYLIQRLCRVVQRSYGRELFGLVEVDETYVGGYRGERKAGRGTTRATRSSGWSRTKRGALVGLCYAMSSTRRLGRSIRSLSSILTRIERS